jgi:protein TonB
VKIKDIADIVDIAFLQAILLHVLLAGGMIAFGRLTPAPEPVIYLNFEMLELAADPAPESRRLEQEAAAPNPAPSPPKPVQSAPVKAQPVIPASKKVFPVPKPAPVPVSINPAPEKPETQDTPEPAASSSSSLESSSTSATADQGQPSGASTKEDAGEAALSVDEQYRRANFSAIRDSILGNLHYPILARRRGWSGQVELSFTIDPDGNVNGLKVLTSSGFPVLDEQAMTAIRRSAPFTPPPPRKVELVMPVTFRLN